jgi:hypothetical protein
MNAALNVSGRFKVNALSGYSANVDALPGLSGPSHAPVSISADVKSAAPNKLHIVHDERHSSALEVAFPSRFRKQASTGLFDQSAGR